MFKRIFNFHFYIWDLTLYYYDDKEYSTIATPFTEEHHYFLTHYGLKRFLKQNENNLIGDDYRVAPAAGKVSVWL